MAIQQEGPGLRSAGGLSVSGYSSFLPVLGAPHLPFPTALNWMEMDRTISPPAEQATHALRAQMFLIVHHLISADLTAL